MEVNLKYTGTDLLFDVTNESGYIVKLGLTDDKIIESVRPMELLLMSLASCSSMDVIKILKTQKQVIEDYKVHVNGIRQDGVVPALFETIEVSFIFRGDLSPSKVKRAVNLSLDKYCSVSKIIEETAKINVKIILNDKEL
jgi:putative redox protein